ncbi:MAG: methyltransferase domain-containing protein [Planctomycetota bacterium]
MSKPAEYVLGASASEFERLRFQQHVWGAVTERFLDRLALRPGARCLDAGCGPGLVLESLSRRAGDGGSVLGLDQSAAMIAEARRLVAEQRLGNVTLEVGSLQDLAREQPFDLIFLRWVLSFPADPAQIVMLLAQRLRPGGVLAIQDYNHHGISLFPDSAGFRAVVDATRALYRQPGGDAFVAGHLPAMLRCAGLALFDLTPNVLAGGPDSDVFAWADRFFPPFSAKMVAAGVLAPADRAAFLRDWEERRRDPDTLFFSPIVCDIAARRPGA